MVASRHPSSRPAGVGSPDRQIGLRPVSSASSSRSVIGACRDQRPQLRLVIDNTVCGPGGAPVAGSGWWRLARQRWSNRHSDLAMSDRLEGLGPVVACVAVVVFGGLVGIRLVQEWSADSPDAVGGADGSVAAVVASTSGAAEPSNPAGPVATGTTVVVHPGESLWSIAVSRYPNHDPRVVVDAFVEVNGASSIQAGQQLIVPAALLEG